jgi:hypothetical protein
MMQPRNLCKTVGVNFTLKVGTKDKSVFEYADAYHELQFEDCKRELFKNTIDWLNLKIKEGDAQRLGALNFEKIKVDILKRKAPFKHWKITIAFAVVFYYLIGYLLMYFKIVNKERHEMLAFWPCQLFKKFFGKK